MTAYCNAQTETIEFFDRIGLPQQWATVLIENGFDEMETLIDIEESDMKELGLPLGHVIKVRRGLRALCAQVTGSTATEHARGYVAAPTLLEEPTLAHTYDLKPHSLGGGVSDNLRFPARVQEALQLTWAQVQTLGTDYVGEVFSQKLFELAPRTHARAGMGWGPVVKGIGHTVDYLSRLEAVAVRYRRLGVLHRCIGVTERELKEMGDAFILALRDVLGKAFTRDAEVGWTSVYGFVSRAMMEDVR